MILHSVAPLPMLLEPEEAPPPETRTVRGVLLAGHRTPEGFAVSRVLSSNPRDYLTFSPGSILPDGSLLSSSLSSDGFYR